MACSPAEEALNPELLLFQPPGIWRGGGKKKTPTPNIKKKNISNTKLSEELAYTGRLSNYCICDLKAQFFMLS